MRLLINKLLPFLILLFVVLGCTKLGRQAPGKLEEQEKVVEFLNKQFNLRDSDRTVRQVVKHIEFDCKFRFREGIDGDKITLIATFCESTSEFTKETEKLNGFLTPENLTLIKNAGFERVVLYDRHENEIIGSRAIH